MLLLWKILKVDPDKFITLWGGSEELIISFMREHTSIFTIVSTMKWFLCVCAYAVIYILTQVLSCDRMLLAFGQLWSYSFPVQLLMLKSSVTILILLQYLKFLGDATLLRYTTLKHLRQIIWMQQSLQHCKYMSLNHLVMF